MILAIDVGGTKVSLALVSAGLEITEKKVFKSQEHSSLTAVIKLFLGVNAPGLRAIVAGIAGPVIARTAKVTNLPWSVSEELLLREFSVPFVRLINDVEAGAWGTLTLKPGSYLDINPGGVNRSGNRGLIAPGTGLGESILHWTGTEYLPSASEGGHSDFAPSSIKDLAFMEWLYKRYPRVSWERVVSGSFGFRNIFEFLNESHIYPANDNLQSLMASADFGRHLSQAAGQNIPIAQATIRTFCRFLGAEAGNLALKACALGGLYIGGGIVPQILPWIKEGLLLESFCEKGRQKILLEQIPIRIILDPDCSLYGAANYAVRALGVI
jgi:glucokinase